MGNLDFSANADQLKELAAYMASQINVPTIGIGGGYAPIGSINFFDATVAPQDWLACDGTVYNIADYPQLADWYEAQHGSKNFYGGDGTTTFAVPDLQGEFLRGTGTNSHANQGNGAAVGVHQDGTAHVNIYSDSGSSVVIADVLQSATNMDSSYDTVSHKYVGGSKSQSPILKHFTSRPTNTSFLICVKAVVAGDVYSTDERVVGTWIDGKPLYQKVLVNTSAIPSDKNISTGVVNGANGYLVGGYVYEDGTLRNVPLNIYAESNIHILTTILADASAIYCDLSVINSSKQVFIIQYTKTTD